jgi:hypothetical protein
MGKENNGDAPVQIKVLEGEWSVTLNGARAELGELAVPILHALVMSDGRVLRDTLVQVLPKKTKGPKDKRAAVRNGLYELRQELDIEIKGDAWVEIPRQPTKLGVDLWDFLDCVGDERYFEAAKLLPSQERALPTLPGGSSHRRFWKETQETFDAERKEVRKIVAADLTLRQSIGKARDELLDRAVAPTGRQVPLRELYEELCELPFRWSRRQPFGDPEEGPPSRYLSALLSEAAPRRLIVTGGAGTGKTLTGKLTFLRLSKGVARRKASKLRPILYIDATAEASQSDFAGDAWLERRLANMGAPPMTRAIIVMVHADSLLSAADSDLTATLGGRLFQDHDVLLCCSEQLYEKGVKYAEYTTHVIKLDPWSAELQGNCVEVLADRRTRLAFEAWRDSDPTGTRERLCAVPLHLIHLLPFVEEKSDALERISTPWHLFDQVASVRLEKARLTGGAQEARLRDLAGLAHRFYEAGEHADRPIGFSQEELRRFWPGSDPSEIDAWVDDLLDRTLLNLPGPASNEIHFEETSWGWFFAAWHLQQTLIEVNPPERPLQAFAKFFSMEVMELCKEMLREALQRHRTQILSALRLALFDDSGADLDAGPRSIAREQIAYLLGILGDPGAHERLHTLIDREADSWDPDPLVRRGVVIGLANRGDRRVADDYVEGLRGERETAGPYPERDANIAFLLSFHGVQRFDTDHPGRVARNIDPSPAVADLVRGLEEDRHAGSWRIKLFTLDDLGHHPAIERVAYRRAIALDRERLRRILDQREADPSTRHWPEPPELRAVLDG